MLTKREQETYRFISSYLLKHQKAPLLSEIAEGLGIQSKGVIHRYLSALENNGYIQRHAKHRGIELLDGPQPGELPLLGSIAAGRPIEAIENRESVNFSELLGAANRYALQVQGDSMINVGIRHEDFVIIEHADSALKGQIVVALIDAQEATLKRISYPKKSLVRLTPENDSMQAQDYPAKRVTIQGVLVAQLRTYT